MESIKFREWESKEIQKLFLYELDWVDHAGHRMNERKINKKWIARALIRGVHYKSKVLGRYLCEHKGKTVVYELVDSRYKVITVWQ